LIGYSPGGLPLVGSHLFVLSVLVLWVELERT
jgi:hypothetical protein